MGNYQINPILYEILKLTSQDRKNNVPVPSYTSPLYTPVPELSILSSNVLTNLGYTIEPADSGSISADSLLDLECNTNIQYDDNYAWYVLNYLISDLYCLSFSQNEDTTYSKFISQSDIERDMTNTMYLIDDFSNNLNYAEYLNALRSVFVSLGVLNNHFILVRNLGEQK